MLSKWQNNEKVQSKFLQWFAFFLLKLLLISFVLGFIPRTCKACGAMRNIVRTNYGRHMISSPIYILQYTPPQILHTFFTIQVCNLIAERFTDTRHYQSAYVALQEDLVAWLHSTICLCANTFIWKLEEMVLAYLTKWRYCLLFKKALAQEVSKWPVQSKSTFSVSFKSSKWVAIDGAKIQESSIGVC